MKSAWEWLVGLPWWGKVGLGALAFIVVAPLLGTPENREAPENRAPQTEAPPLPAIEPPHSRPESVRAISGPDVLAIVVSSQMQSDEYRVVAREACTGKDFCKAFVWSDSAEAATALPMTDREYSSMVFSYGMNRQTGYDQSLWNCARSPRSSASECMATD